MNWARSYNMAMTMPSTLPVFVAMTFAMTMFVVVAMAVVRAVVAVVVFLLILIGHRALLPRGFDLTWRLAIDRGGNPVSRGILRGIFLDF
jgi:hypothetical protein